MTWILIAYLLGLFYFTACQERIQNKGMFRTTWLVFALIPFKNFIFTLFTAGHMRSPRDLALIEVWSTGFSWLLLGISLFVFINAMIPTDLDKPNAFNLDDFRTQ